MDERSRRNRPVNEGEAWDFILISDGLWIWRTVCYILTQINGSETPDVFILVQTRASIFVQSGRELAATSFQFDQSDTRKLWEIFSAVQLQLRTLDSFSLVYSRKYNQTLDRDVTHSWSFSLQQRVADAQKVLETQGDVPLRSPSQRFRDNIVLQTIVGLVILSCI